MLEFKFIFGENGHAVSEALRRSVFEAELGIKNPTDEYEGGALHFVGYDKTVQIACARMRKIAEGGFKIEYLAIKEDYRRQYVGDLVMRALADKAVSEGGGNIIVETPAELSGFFEFEGYEKYADVPGEDGHIMMRRDLSKIQPCRGCAK